MDGTKQSKRVSWAPGFKLCQVRLFLSEDAPFQSGSGAQDDLQAKGSWLLHAAATGNDDSLPPGFESSHPAYKIRAELSQIPVIKWKRPHKIPLYSEWLVVAGEESEEVGIQDHRQSRTLEAIYPRTSNIPPNPFVSSEVQDSNYDDSKTPLISMTAIEDEDMSEQVVTPQSLPIRHPDLQKNLPGAITMHVLPDTGSTTPTIAQCKTAQAAVAAPSCSETLASGFSSVVEPDYAAAANAAVTAIMKSKEEGSMIDPELLMSILSNPSLVEKLLLEQLGASSQPQPSYIPVSAPPPPPPVVSVQQPPSQIHVNSHMPLSGIRPPPLYPMANLMPTVGASPQTLPAIQNPTKTSLGAPPVKDINYYKSLIQQHGGEKSMADSDPLHAGNYQNNFVSMNDVESVNSGVKQQRDVKPKIAKPCIYFNTPKGCRHGASCLYQHDSSVTMRIEQHKGSKRYKLDRGIGERH